ncbi:MAG: hypothetical protein HOD85_35020 [Deltaproteobacteria bacterium]|jgi:hypothetical protein|nr:hypothetical protein [Deltaproteobacteria bacterium]
MTNTLHRKGSAEDLQKDFVIFALPKLGMLPVKEVIGRLKRFSEICVRHDPLNMGKVDKMALRRIDPTRLRAEMEDNIGLTATFDNIEAVASVVAELKQADLGISVNISGLLTSADECCQKAGMNRHSVEQSLGIFGQKGRLPQNEIVEINTLCGHGLVAFNLIRKIIDEIKLERMTPAQGALHLAKPCECGVFNIRRAQELLEKLRQRC